MIIKFFFYSISILLFIGFTSCKKDRICACKVVDKTGGGNSTYDVTYTIHNVTKSTAKTNCVDYEVKDVSSNETINYDCTLKQ